MANSGTGHGRFARTYVRVPGATTHALIPKLASSGTAVSQFDIQEPNDLQEDTGHGDENKTKVPGLGDWQASCRFFVQDSDQPHIQYDLMRAARNSDLVHVMHYPLLGRGVDNFYYSGNTYWSMTSLPSNVGELISANFDVAAAGSIELVTPSD